MASWIARYTKWLHTQWPAGTAERLPEVRADGSTSVPGLYVVGDLTGIPLLKFAADTGARAVQRIAADPGFVRRKPSADVLDLVIIGGGISGFSAAMEARKAGLRSALVEASEPFSTIVNFPRAKPIYTYPTEMVPAGELQLTAEVKEELVEELRRQTLERGIVPTFGRVEQVRRRGDVLEVELAANQGSGAGVQGSDSHAELSTPDSARRTLLAHRVIVAIGRSGNFRKLAVPGEELDKVYNRLHDPKDYAGKDVLVVGGGDSALETAIAIAECGGNVTLSYRKPAFSRPKPENIERLRLLQRVQSGQASSKQMPDIENPSSERQGTAVGGYMDAYRKGGWVELMMPSEVRSIGPEEVALIDSAGAERTIPNDAVLAMIGREAPLDFFRKSGVNIRGEWRAAKWATLIAVLLFCVFLYHWKKTGIGGFERIPGVRSVTGIGQTFSERKWWPHNITANWPEPASALGKTMRITLGEPGFYYSLAYCACVVGFGIRRIRRTRTPYVRLQTWTLAAFQVVPLFLLPYFVLPWLGHAGAFDHGFMERLADALFPRAGYGQGREYWRSFGFILAWPLFFWNVFTDQPMWTWLAISFVQSFVLIPGIIYFWGKGAYCGWICSCGALAETLGDAHRQKMPHGPFWNRLNMAGQAILAFAVALLLLRIAQWAHVPKARQVFDFLFHDMPALNYAWFVDLLLAGILGVGLYFHFSGRVWCRFFCPLAALMHVYARFSRFRILADKKKCISCNVCTSVCHQGIDVMNFANKGLPMADPECVRCSACVSSCPTGVLSFGQVDRRTGRVLKTDRLAASPVQMVELTRNGRKLGKELVSA